MQRNSQPESGHFSPRVAVAMVFCLIGISLAMLSFAAPTSSSTAPVAGTVSAGPIIIKSEFNGDLRSLAQTITNAERLGFLRPEFEAPDFGPKQLLAGARTEVPSPDVSAISAPMPIPIKSFDAMTWIANGDGHPPDTVGDVGPNHFVQAVNTSVGIYDKATGNALSTVSFVS